MEREGKAGGGGGSVGLIPVRPMRTLSLSVLAVWCLSCGSNSAMDAGATSRQPTPQELFKASSAVKSVTVEIDYAPNAAPYTGSAGTLGDTFSLFVTNAQRLFMSSNKTLTLPTQLSEMEALTETPGGQVTTQQILGFAALHRGTPSTTAAASFYVLFLDSYFQDDSGVRMDVLGVSIGNTGVIALFKPVIKSTQSTLFPNLVRFVEQTTLVHEFGHAVGLVNNGAPTTTAHQDTAHGAHCTNDACAMYWQNEGAAAAVDFAKRYVTSGTTVIFAADCLADIDALK